MQKTLLPILLFLVLAGAGWWAVRWEAAPYSSTVEVRRHPPSEDTGRAEDRPRFLGGAVGFAISVDEALKNYQLQVTEFDPQGRPDEGLARRFPGAAAAFPHWPKRNLGVGTGRVTQVELVWELPGRGPGPGDREFAASIRDGRTGSNLDHAPKTWIRDGYLHAALHPYAVHPLPVQVTLRDEKGAVEWCYDFALPGLPVENADLDNFFDLHLPCLVLRDPLDALRFVEGVAQLEVDPDVEIDPYSFRPVAYTGTTLEDVLEDLLAHDPTGSIHVDHRTRRIVRRISPWERFQRWLKPRLP